MSATPRPSFKRSSSLLCLAALSASVGCADNEISFYIRAIKQPTSMGATCGFSNDPSGSGLFEGVLDLAFKSTYHLAPLMQTNIAARADLSSNRTESSQIIIEGFVVEVREDSPTGPLITGSFANPYTVYQTIVIPPGSGGTAGFGVGFFEAIPTQIGRALYQDVCVTNRGIVRPAGLDARCPVPVYNPSVSKRIIVAVSAFGHTGGGVSVESPKFNFPVTTCCGCLRFFPAAAGSTTTGDAAAARVNPVCATSTTTGGLASCPNIMGQDYLVDCNLCSTSRPDLCQPFGFAPAGTGLTCN